MVRTLSTGLRLGTGDFPLMGRGYWMLRFRFREA